MRPAPAVTGESSHVVARANVLLPGLYAWLSTVAYPAASSRAHVLAQITAGAALLCLGAGTWLVVTRPSVGRLLGLVAFVALSALTWLILGDRVGASRLEPIRSALGAVAWALFAFGWGAVRRPDDVPEDDPRAIVDEVLPARRALPAGAAVVFGVALVLGLAPVFVAWRVARPEHALLGHAAAFAAAVSMVSAGALVAVERGKVRTAPSPRRRLARASAPLAALAVLVAAGVAYGVLG